jgi:hypothetical protein
MARPRPERRVCGNTHLAWRGHGIVASISAPPPQLFEGRDYGLRERIGEERIERREERKFSTTRQKIFTDSDAQHRENDLPHLSPEGRGRANEVSEGEGVRKLGIILMRPSPLTTPSPLWGEGVHDRREKRIAHFTLPCRAGQSHVGIEKRTKRNRLWNKSTKKGLRFSVRSAYAIPLPERGRIEVGVAGRLRKRRGLQPR